MTTRHAVFALLLLAPSTAAAQTRSEGIRVEPAVVSVSSQGATTAILTFSAVAGYAPGEGVWCARLVEAMDRGARCDPATIYGQAPAGGARTVSSGGVFTDVMSVPASVAQRAYEAALAGEPSRFFYVRQFVSSAGKGIGPDQYVVVSCLLGGGGASAPFALTNVRLRLESETPVLFVTRGESPPPLLAEIAYTGTGRLRGRWEVVLPGEEPPSRYDLLTEGSLPPSERGLQRRYLEIERFNVLLLPTGRFTLPGPDPARLPTSVDGAYMILLRVEVSDDGRSDVRIGSAAGRTVIHNGAAAGFPMPTLRYVVGASRTRSALSSPRLVRLRLPPPDAFVSPDSALTLSWVAERGAGRYRVEIQRLADGESVLSAIVAEGVGVYDVPPFVLAGVPDGRVRWRVVALDADGSEVGHSEWRSVQRRPPS
ncbi:MAG: hypothetical protein HY704_13655 [Gemmatimonadetes bacterium]|nr:hypothetical protein [Gemmatimonadota bacterium]